MTTEDTKPVVVVTGANGLVGSHVVQALAARGATVRAVTRKPGRAPEADGIEEWVGEFYDPGFAEQLSQGAAAVINTVHPMADDDRQEESVGWAPVLAKAAVLSGVPLFVHVSSTAVYNREQDTGDVDESSALASDDDNAYAVTKRDADHAVEGIDGITRVIARPTAILGRGETSVWNTLRPRRAAEDENGRTEDPDRSFGWVHVNDVANFVAAVALGEIALADDAARGPVEGRATAVNLVTGTVPMREYFGPLCEAIGVEPAWEERDAFRSELKAERARAWGWQPAVSFEEAMAELVSGLRTP